MRYAVANTSYVSFQKSNRIPIEQYSSDKTKILVETAIYRVSKPTILYK
ncbi:MAG: hypothetical protein V7K69_28095 [Nostoc sp.]